MGAGTRAGHKAWRRERGAVPTSVLRLPNRFSRLEMPAATPQRRAMRESRLPWSQAGQSVFFEHCAKPSCCWLPYSLRVPVEVGADHFRRGVVFWIAYDFNAASILPHRVAFGN